VRRVHGAATGKVKVEWNAGGDPHASAIVYRPQRERTAPSDWM